MAIFGPTRFGMALGGGGIRGLAHIGVLRALDDEGLHPSYLSGTSMGGLIASLYASGMSSQQLEMEALQLSRPAGFIRLVELRPPRRGLLGTGRVRSYLEGLLGKDREFSSLGIPTVLIAVDLERGEEVLLGEGAVLDAVMATTAVPSVFDPVRLGGRFLVDGGVLDNVPAEVVRKMGAEVAVAVDVGSGTSLLPSSQESPRHGFAALLPQVAMDLLQTEGIMMDAITAEHLRRAKPEVVIRPSLPPGVTSFSGLERTREIIEAGREAARAEMPRLRRALAAGPRRVLRRLASTLAVQFRGGTGGRPRG